MMYLGRAILFILCLFLVLEAMQFFVGYQTGRTDIVTSLNHITVGPGLVDLLDRPFRHRQPDPLALLTTRRPKPQGRGLGLLPYFYHIHFRSVQFHHPGPGRL
ncbi:MAG: hypothetical protein U5R30_09195 [Deltaproteobacteria bacterium]|nr:hypothetical protein [Deltaproteobacteria bacterium]